MSFFGIYLDRNLNLIHPESNRPLLDPPRVPPRVWKYVEEIHIFSTEKDLLVVNPQSVQEPFVAAITVTNLPLNQYLNPQNCLINRSTS